MPVPNTEPAKLLSGDNGIAIAVGESVFDGLRWSLRKLAIMDERGLSADAAEAIVRAEMDADAVEKGRE